MRRLFHAAAIGCATSLIFAKTATAQTPLADSTYLRLGRQYYEWFAGGQVDSVLAHMAEDSRAQLGGADGLRQRMDEFMLRAGAEQKFIEEKMTRRRGNPQYWREASYTNFTDESLVFRWVFDAEGRIAGIGLGPRSRTPAPDSLPPQ